MAARLKLAGHLSAAELRERYDQCKDAVEKTHWLFIRRVAAQGEKSSARRIAQQMGIEESWARRLIKRYNELGAEGLMDRRKQNRSQGVLDAAAQEALLEALSKEPSDGGLWNAPKVAAWAERHLGRRVSDMSAWRWLRKMGWSAKAPRPSHEKSASPEEREAYKKRSARSLRGSSRKTPAKK